MDSLESQLHPHRFDLVQGIKKLQYIISQTVRSGTNGQCHDIRMGDGFCEDLTQVFHRSICVCICLKIGDIFMNRAFGRETFDLCVDLLCNGKSGVCCKISASALAAEDAAFFCPGCRHGWDRTCRRLMQPGRPFRRIAPGAYSPESGKACRSSVSLCLFQFVFLFVVFVVFIFRYIVIEDLYKDL